VQTAVGDDLRDQGATERVALSDQSLRIVASHGPWHRDPEGRQQSLGLRLGQRERTTGAGLPQGSAELLGGWADRGA
jgi:hypothetical protein